MANVVFNIARQQMSTGELNLSAADTWVMLTDGYVPNIETHNYVSAVNAYEVGGDGYTRYKLENTSLTRDTINNRMVYTADNLSWMFANFEADGAVLFVNTGNDNTSSLITFLDFGGTKRSQNTPFQLIWGEEGILNLR